MISSRSQTSAAERGDWANITSERYICLMHRPKQAIEVEPPLFGDLDEAPDELVVHISEEDTSPAISDRVASLARAMQLTPAELRLASSVGLEDAAALKQRTETASGTGRADTLGGLIKLSRHPRGLSDHLFRASRRRIWCSQCSTIGLLPVKPPLERYPQAFFRWHASSYKGQSSSQDNVFRFLRACDYGLPQLFSVVELFATRLIPTTNYSLFIAEMPRWFRAEVLKNLDEQGIPVQISERFLEPNDDIESLQQRLIAEASGPATLLL